MPSKLRSAIDAGAKIVGIVGRLDHVKGHDLFLDAAADVLRTLPDTQFLVLGSGDLLEELQTKAESLGIAANVQFLGHRKDILDIVQQLDVYVSASISEGMSLAIMEAMSVGRAIVATNVGGVAEQLEDDVSGILVPSGQVAPMADALVRLLSDDQRRDSLGANARQRFVDKFSPTAIASRIESSYQRLLGQ